MFKLHFPHCPAAAAASDATVTGTVLGASYDLGVAKVMVNLLNQKTKNNLAGTATKSAETNFGVSVPMGKTTLMAGVGTDKTKNAAGVKSTGLDYSIGASYAMSKRTNVFAFTSQDETPALKGASNPVTNTTTVGLRHTF
jgi:predicted porin